MKTLRVTLFCLLALGSSLGKLGMAAETETAESAGKNMTETIQRAAETRNQVMSAHAAQNARVRKEEIARIKPVSHAESALKQKPMNAKQFIEAAERPAKEKVKAEKISKSGNLPGKDQRIPPGLEKKNENPPKGWEQGKKEGWKDDSPPGLSGKFRGFFGGSKKEK